MLAKFLTSNTGPLPTQLSGHSRHWNIPGRYWSNSGQRSIVALNASVANDLSATLVHDGNGNWNATRKELLSKSMQFVRAIALIGTAAVALLLGHAVADTSKKELSTIADI